MNVCVSIDGVSGEVNDAIRVGSDLREVTANRDRFRAATRSYGSVLGINHCLMVQNWPELGAVLLEADALDADVNVIPVIYPPAFSLTCLPHDELVPVVDALVVQDAELAPQLTRNRGAWDGVLSQLRSVLAQDQPDGVAVTVGPSAELGQRDDDLLRHVEGELTEWAGQGPLSFDTERGVVRAVRGAGPWAAPMAPDTWLDRPAPVILDELRQHLGAVQDLDLDASPTVRWATCSVRLDEGPVPHRVAVVEWHEGRTRWTRTFVARPLADVVAAR
jgi:hypothetical protein